MMSSQGSQQAAVQTDGLTSLDGQPVYQITDVDRMPPFLTSIASDSDLWMYVSSHGGVTAGRIDESHCLFPYETEDKLYCSHGTTGPFTLVRLGEADGAWKTWEPFTGRDASYEVHRNLYKDVGGGRITFEEINQTLGLSFRYSWAASDEFGFVRTATLSNTNGASAIKVHVVDGLLNVLPAGLELVTQQTLSCLADAYKLSELDPAARMGLFSLSSLLCDRAEPAEALRANVVWSRGLDDGKVLLCGDQLEAFRAGAGVQEETVLKGRRGNYLLFAPIQLGAGELRTWQIVADVERNHLHVERLRAWITGTGHGEVAARIAAGLEAARRTLLSVVASADGLEATADRAATATHQCNVLSNCMRGGMFYRNYEAPAEDFVAFVRQRNAVVYATHKFMLDSLKGAIECGELRQRMARTADANLMRLAYEYLPITFSRRHGDPSRPWNRFAIHVKHEDGSRVLSYQGNWRDIFQNWEALCLSFPGFIENIIAKFVNAMTVDGFNAPRIARDGIEWEVPDPDHPWSNIGYWGDHQIVYLSRFLEASQRVHPQVLQQLLEQPIFVYANVPYRLKPYDTILKDTQDTIVFDRQWALAIDRQVAQIGGDGKLLLDGEGRVYHVNLVEKLLVPILCKLSNLVVDGGIWMNTQRPEWNDANNALAGGGVSMVTHCYLRRHVALCIELIGALGTRAVSVSSEVGQWLDNVRSVLRRYQPSLAQPSVSDAERKEILDGVGAAFSFYRARVYQRGFSGRTTVASTELVTFLHLALAYLDHGIRANRRPDGLYHAYNLLDVSADGREASIGRLYEMLEGQVAALSCGLVGAEEAANLLDALFASAMYRPDQNSFLLYPQRVLPGFLEKNVVPAVAVDRNPLLVGLIGASNPSIIGRDVQGRYRFNAAFRSVRYLHEALVHLGRQDRWAALVAAHGSEVEETYESVFNHRAFTGRSGAMFGYEGIGCVFWHMIGKLLVAAQECYFRAVRERADTQTVRRLGALYFRIRAGLGFNKTARAYGAFPIDAHSHTPRQSGARQPGLTGHVKEQILARTGEMGVRLEAGQVILEPVLLRRSELLSEPMQWACQNVQGQEERLSLRPGSAAFTACQTPVVYEQTQGDWQMTIYWRDGQQTRLSGNRLDNAASEALLNRTGRIQRIEVQVPQRIMQFP